MPPVATIDSEVTIESYDHTLRVELGHPNEARIRQRHRHVGELAHQTPERIDLRTYPEVDFHDLPGEKLEHGGLEIEVLDADRRRVNRLRLKTLVQK